MVHRDRIHFVQDKKSAVKTCNAITKFMPNLDSAITILVKESSTHIQSKSIYRKPCSDSKENLRGRPSKFQYTLPWQWIHVSPFRWPRKCRCGYNSPGQMGKMSATFADDLSVGLSLIKTISCRQLKVTGRPKSIHLHAKTVPRFKVNLISVGQLAQKMGIKFTTENVCMSDRSHIWATAEVIGTRIKNNVYELKNVQSGYAAPVQKIEKYDKGKENRTIRRHCGHHKRK